MSEYNPNANWTAQVATQAQHPVYFLNISGLSTVEYSTGPVKGAVITKKEYMRVPRSVSSSAVDLIDGTFSTQAYDVELIDVANEITDLVATEASGAPLSTLINRKVTLYGGYASLDESDYPAIFVGRIAAVRMNADLTGYFLRIADDTRFLGGELCTDATKSAPSVIEGNVVNVYWSLLTGTFDTGHATYPLASVSGAGVQPTGDTTIGGASAFTSPGRAYDDLEGSEATGGAGAAVAFTFDAGTESGRISVLARVDEAGMEMVLSYSVDGGTTVIEFARVTSTAADTTQVLAGQGDGPEEVLGPLLAVVDMSQLQIHAELDSTTSSTGRIGDVRFKSSVPTGLSVPTTSFDDTALTNERDTWHQDDTIRVVLLSPVDSKSFIQREFFRIFQTFPVVSGEGLLSLKFMAPVLPLNDAPTLDENNIVEVRSWRRAYEDHLNKFTYYGDFDPVENEVSAALYDANPTTDTDDRTATLETVEYRADSLILRSDLNGVEIARELAGRMRHRYLFAPADITVAVTMRKRALEQGAVISVTHAQLPDLDTGTRAMTARSMIVTAINPDFSAGLIVLRLIDTGWSRYGVIPPNTQVDYASATDADKATYFFIADEADDLMADNTAGYELI